MQFVDPTAKAGDFARVRVTQVTSTNTSGMFFWTRQKRFVALF